MLIFLHPHHHPGNTVLNILELLEAPARNSDHESITVIQPGGNKGVDELLCSGEGEGGAKFGNNMEVEEGRFADVVDIIFKSW